MVKTTKDRLKVAGRAATGVASARYAFHVEMYIASAIPPTSADTSRMRRSEVNPGAAVTGVEISAPSNISSFRPYRSDRMENGILNTTAASPNVDRMTPTLVTETPSSGRKTVIATS
jgi:hypothetical protein